MSGASLAEEASGVRPAAPPDHRAADTRPPAVAFEEVTKRFGERVANGRVSFTVRPGTVCGLVGENGAGKTTAMNVLAGIYLPDEGRVRVDGSELQLGSPKASVHAGIGMVPQHQRLVETLTAAENISLALHRGRVLQPRQLPRAVHDLRGRLGFGIDPDAKVWRLTLAQRQQLEILRVLATGATVVVLDEPTAVLSPLEVEGLFTILRGIAGMGHAVVLITHKLHEVIAVADDAVVMRRGRVVHQGPVAETDIATLVRLVIGSQASRGDRRPERGATEPVLELDGVTVLDGAGRPLVKDVSLTVRRGELVALVGVTGNGQSELMEAVGGLRRVAQGTIRVPRRDGRRNFAFIPEERLGVGLAPGLSLVDNALLGRQWFPPFGPWLRRRALRRQAEEVAGRFAVDVEPTAPVSHLSGGNLQRLVLGRELASANDLVVACYPTRGLDVGSATAIRRALTRAADGGAGVLVASEELEESLAIATRIVVLHQGLLVGDLPADDADVEAVARLMTTGRSS